jgi:hypothetical protein
VSYFSRPAWAQTPVWALLENAAIVLIRSQFMRIIDCMLFARWLMTALLAVVSAGSLQAQRVDEYFHVDYQADSFPVQLRAQTIAGTVTQGGKPIDGTMLSLHKFLGAYSSEPSHADAHVLGKTITAKDGRFRFGKVPSGMYVVFVRGGSIDIALVKPKKSESDIVAIENFADSCVSVTVLSEDAKERTYGSTSPCY